jgi:hypothetical protein
LASIVWSLLFLAIASALALHSFRYSMFDIDLSGYARSFALLEPAML